MMDEARSVALCNLALYLECGGPEYDGTDPLWDEIICSVLASDDEDIGDSDLSKAARKRLEAEGLYRLVDADHQDEWLCIPGASLSSLLHGRLAQARRKEWLSDEVRDAQQLWHQVSQKRTDLQHADVSTSSFGSSQSASSPPNNLR